MVSNEHLITVLEIAIGIKVTNLVRRRSNYGTSHAIEDVVVTFADGSSLVLMLKDLHRDAMLADARDVKPSFLHDPLREALMYARVLQPEAHGTARCYLPKSDHERGRAWLLLEKVAGVELYQVGDVHTWETVARSLAHLHLALRRRSFPEELSSRLLLYDEAWYARWLERARGFAAEKTFPEEEKRAMLQRVFSWYEEFVPVLCALPRTLIHGEFYASNILLNDVVTPSRICPVDWEMAAIAPPAMDVAALISGSWPEEIKQRIALSYFAEMRESDLVPETEETYLRTVELCRLATAVRLMGWSPHWSPPREHAVDWLAEAYESTERITDTNRRITQT